jgi:hypothetical protein
MLLRLWHDCILWLLLDWDRRRHGMLLLGCRQMWNDGHRRPLRRRQAALQQGVQQSERPTAVVQWREQAACNQN